LAKGIVSDLSRSLKGMTICQEEIAMVIARRVREESKRHGISELWLKSYMMRIQRGNE
jgi:hypothetical protein